jgi:hypothetical protein
MKFKDALAIVINLAKDSLDENLQQDIIRDKEDVKLHNQALDIVQKYANKEA